MQIFSERLKDLRQEKNLSLDQLGKILNVDHTTISRWEKGTITPGIDHLYNLAVYFQVSCDYLVGLED